MFCEASLDGDFPLFWSLLTDNLRLCEAQLWVHANRSHPHVVGYDLEELAVELAKPQSSHHLRPHFEEARMAMAAETLPRFVHEGRAGLASHRRILSNGHEAVLLLDSSEIAVIPEGTLVTGSEVFHVLLFEPTDSGWLVAGHDYNPPKPGWPPSSGVPIEPAV